MATANEQKRAERVRQYKLNAASHKLKNRSSKGPLTISNPRWDRYNFFRSYSRTFLEELSKTGMFEADMELERRNRKRAKKAAKTANS